MPWLSFCVGSVGAVVAQTDTGGVLAPDERQRLFRRVRLLAWASLGWMTVEGVVAVVAGIWAGSIALIGFGIDSAIEGIASVVIIWRFWGKRASGRRASSARLGRRRPQSWVERTVQVRPPSRDCLIVPLCRAT